MFTEIDHWIGRTLFVPLIIRLCQLTRQTQFALSRLFWFIAALDGFYRAERLCQSKRTDWNEDGARVGALDASTSSTS